MSERVTWETSFEVRATKNQIYDAVEGYRYRTYNIPSGRRFGWATSPAEGAMVTLLDNSPWNGHVAIHFYPIDAEVFRITIQANQPLLSRKRDDTPAPMSVEHAQALAELLQDIYGIAETLTDALDDGWTPPKCIFVGNEGEFYGQAHRRLRARNFPVQQLGYALWVYQPEPHVHPQKQYGQIRMYGITPWGVAGGHCRLEFELVPGESSWALSKASIEQLIDDLRVDGWIVEAGMAETWTPPPDCIFKGTKEEFLDEGYGRLKALWDNCERLSTGLNIYAADVDRSAWLNAAFDWVNPRPASPPSPLCQIIPRLVHGGHCRLVFQLNEGDWEDARQPIELLLDDLRRDGLIETQIIETPLLPEPEEVQPVAKKPLLKCNQWLFDQYFNHGRTNYQELRQEWLRIRKEEDFKVRPTDPIASMRTAVNEEKERRGIG